MIKKAIIFIICLLANLTITSQVKADEIVVSVNGNGTGSSNQVQVTAQNTTQVAQNNNANVTNTVNSNSNTGNNNANTNTGGSTAVATGDSQSSTTVNNQNINSNSASSNCGCQNSSSVYISGNGTDSINSVTQSNNGSVIVNQNNTANISNNININANTGNNTASYNGGSASITTGSIYALTTINNKNINNSLYTGGNGFESSLLKIANNGEGSFNNAILTNTVSVVVTDTNLASITNNVEHNLNTGGNTTLGNLGDAVIVTGGIVSKVIVNNENINSSFVKVDCECNPGEVPPTPPTTPTTPPSITPNISIVQPATGSSSPSSGPAAGNILPVTGSSIPWSLVATLLFFFMFLSGLYLRFHGANAPPSRV